jgi:geranylgeranyl pyrophosphate synthase
MQLKKISRPIERELIETERVLKGSLKNTKYKSILEINNYLLDTGGKKIRPMLVLLSAKAVCQSLTSRQQLTKIAAAVELIHRASLIHDDVVDHADLRHNRATINSKWNQDVSIAFGDYLYSVAFELIADCGNPDIIRCVSSATKAMCEGELLQVCERDNLDLLKQGYILLVKKKTAALFAASCQAGVLISNPQRALQMALREYGLNFGIAFQIIDDYLDVVGEEKILGKSPGQDIAAGEITLPILNLWESISQRERKELETLLAFRRDRELLDKIRIRLFDSGAADKTKKAALSFINSAKEKLNILSYSSYKESLLKLADFIIERGFDDKS